MVSTPSAAAQASENEKRRKQTMEKVKANHLSRQLQMRLQYARLKVEHGWQKQNLNEVENLYFHNSHLRGSKPFPVPTITTTQQQHATFSSPHVSSTQSSLSFKLGSSSLGRNVMNSTSGLGADPSTSIAPEGTSTNPGTQTTLPELSLFLGSSTRFNLPADTLTMLVEPQEESAPALIMTTIPDHVASNGPSEDVNPVQGEPPIPTNSLSPSQDSQSPIDTSTANHYPSVKPSRPRPQKAPSGTKALASLSAKDMYNFGSASTLTYDSFWSSHSGSTTPRPPRKSGIAEIVPTFQIPGDFTSGFPDLGHHTTNTPLTSLSTLQSQQ
ncbi:hypothetical protein GALMADRAFT_144892 [Galerina marginata CBS 339.88]|uniref:Uncharacterized protein n=1 Tax=Galerina marginata (strain CBS 339.88) TaxID=685588 RepID=A0A067SJL7_GALM3|nr:hypothetical protein GALMADRAFT_144892 [Galerina marginata CBS 339.88]